MILILIIQHILLTHANNNIKLVQNSKLTTVSNTNTHDITVNKGFGPEGGGPRQARAEGRSELHK